MKTLYFEGAGWEEAHRGEIPNCRIRTAFTNNDGKKIYLEILGYEKSVEDEKKYKRYSQYKIGDAIGFIDYCHYITENPEIDDCNKSRLPCERKADIVFSYQGILNFVNAECNCTFEKIAIANDLSGYRVFQEKYTEIKFDRYNYGDEFNYNADLIKLRKEIHEHFYNIEKTEGKQYSNFSLWVDENDIHLLHLLRHYNGYNKHWIIRTDCSNWMDNIQEAKLGQYAC